MIVIKPPLIFMIDKWKMMITYNEIIVNKIKKMMIKGWENNMIPKVINYCWFGGKTLPKLAKKCIKSWEKYCSDYKIIQWDESNFDIECNSFVKNAYKSKQWAFVSDYARLKIIYENGGVYFDTDVEVLRNIDPLLNDDCFVGIQQKGKYIATGLGFGATANHTMIKSMLEKYDDITFNEEYKERILCPYLNTEAFIKFGFIPKNEIQKVNGTVIYPSQYFDPISPGENCNLICEKTFSIHHYSASWTSTSNKIKRKAFILIGQDNINKIKYRLKNNRIIQNRSRK